MTIKPPGPVGSEPYANATRASRSPLGLDGRGLEIPPHLGPGGLLLAPDENTPPKNAPPKVSVKKLKMPDPPRQAYRLTAQLHKYDWPLFIKNNPQPTDVIQQVVWNCALASILSALANTPDGKKRLRDSIQTLNGRSVTAYEGKHFNTFDPPRQKESDRLFKVKLQKKTSGEIISDVFFADQQTSPVMTFMKAKPDILWPSVFEKAYGLMVGGYEKFSTNPVDVWKDVVGKEPKFLSLVEKYDNYHKEDKPYLDQARKAKSIPMIAALWGVDAPPGVIGHGVTVLGATRSSLEIYDPMKQKSTNLSLKELRGMNAILYYGAL